VRRMFLPMVALALFFALAGQAQAGFLGHSINAQYLYPDQSTVFTDLGTKPVTPLAHFNSFGQTNYDVTDANISITNSFGGPVTFLTAAFNGVSFRDVDATPTITGVTINPATNLAGFDASRVSFTGDTVFVNLQSLITQPDTLVSLDVQFAGPAVPEPASLALLAIGGASLAGFGWRRRRQNVG
jgi:hypothetical protein